MARCTIRGCVDLYTGEIRFNPLSDCLIQDACIELSGEHRGQVALTLSGGPTYQAFDDPFWNATPEDCNDTFYSECIDYSTGRFKIIVPDALIYIASDGLSSGTIWKIDSSAAAYDVTGEGIDPDCKGDYYLAGIYGSKPYYKREDEAYYCWWYSTSNWWVISETAGVLGDFYWYNSNPFLEIEGWYVPAGTASGTAKFYALDQLTRWHCYGRPGNAVKVDAAGNVYIAMGQCKGAVVLKLDSSGQIIWTYGTEDGSEIEHANGIDVDVYGNVYLCGTSETGKNVWKLDRTGKLIWSHLTLATQNMKAIAVDTNGDVYVAGWANVADPDVYKLNGSDGSEIWNFKTNDHPAASNRAHGIAVSPDNNSVYVVGNIDLVDDKSVWKLNSSNGNELGSYDTEGNTYGVTVGPNGYVYVGGANGESDNNIWKLSSGLAKQWGTDTEQTVMCVAVDADLNVCAGGGGPTSPGGSPAPPNIWKLDSSGNIIWNYITGGRVYGIAVDVDNVIHAVGFTDYYTNVHKISTCCGHIWNFKTASYPAPHDIVADASGNVYVAADTDGVYKLDKDGNELWHTDESDTSGAFGIAVDNDGDVYVAAAQGATKLNGETGAVIWHETIGGISRRIAVDAAGNAYLAANKPDGKDESVWKLDTDDGHVIWSFFTGHDTYGIAVGPTGDVAVAGRVTNETGDWADVWKLTSGGAEIWRHRCEPSEGGGAGKVDMDADGNVYATGAEKKVYKLSSASGSVLWSSAAMDYQEQSFDGLDIFVDSFNDIYVVTSGIDFVGGIWHWACSSRDVNSYELVWMCYTASYMRGIFKGCIGNNVLQ